MSRYAIQLTPQSIWDEEAVLDEFLVLGINQSHHDRFMRALFDQFMTGKIKTLAEYRNPETNMPPKLEVLCKSEKFVLMTTKVIKREDSMDGSTSKFLFELQDKNVVECVLMRYSNTFTQEHTRTTICLSSQVGCAQACTFCATGMLGLSRSLTQGEILEQFVWCHGRVEQLRNVVFMGQGEPLAEEVYKNVVQTVKILTSQGRFSLRENRVTVSTVGVVKNLQDIIETFPNITIALSLHAPTQTIRQKIVPSARKYSLQQLIELIDVYNAVTKKKMLIEYVMLDGINCDEECAHLLGKLLQGRDVLLNLIPFNPTLTRAKHIAPSNETVKTFAEIITTNYGLLVTARKEFGQDISGACGQLASSAKKMKKRTIQTSADITQDQNTDNDRGYMIIDDFEAGITDVATEQQKAEDFVEDGLEGIVSAMGWLQKEDTNAPQEIGVIREDIIDNTGCSTAEKTGDIDMEDILTPALPKKTPQSTTVAPVTGDINDKEYQEVCSLEGLSLSQICEGNCHCHRPLRHRLVTQGIDENNIYDYSMAVLNVGRRLIEEQLVVNKKKGETNKTRTNRLVDGNPPVIVDNSDNISINSISLNAMSSMTRAAQPVSSLKITPREKDLVSRVFLPSTTTNEKIQITEKNWDAGPIVYKKTDDDLVTAPKKIEKADSGVNQKIVMVVMISVLIAALVARRLM